MNTDDNKDFYSEFGQLLAKKYSSFVPDQASSNDVGYERAQALGKYLHASRFELSYVIDEASSGWTVVRQSGCL